jgi:KUP system potassium uptake protein
VVPLSLVVLIALFLVQPRGTGRVGAMFGPVLLIWFVVIAALGISGIARHPAVLGAINPMHAVRFFAENGSRGFLVLGAVFLVATGGEALYADMGHFGELPIQIDWFCLVGPSLLLNYLGQGALLLADPSATENPFYRLAPDWALYPLVALATMAAIIASQAIISGAFSLTRQAIQLGYLPRMRIVHTSSKQIGQIYIPAVNVALMVGTVALVLGFRNSSNVAGAYGVAVATTMVITTLLAFLVSRQRFGWSLPLALAVTVPLVLVDLAFLGANLIKVGHGGWLPLGIGVGVLVLMTTWRTGREVLSRRLATNYMPIKLLLQEMESAPPARAAGTAVFLTSVRDVTPPALLHNIEHNQVLHERVVLLTVTTLEIPHVDPEARVAVGDLGRGFYQLLAQYGFMETPNMGEILAAAARRGLAFKESETTFFLGREVVLPTRGPGMALWREKLFDLMTRLSRSAVGFFCIPPDRVVEIGLHVEL